MFYKALKLRTEGHSIEDIAEKLNSPVDKVAKGIKKALEVMRNETAETVEEVRQLEVRRLDEILRAHWPHKLIPRHAELIMKTMERRAKFLGLDQQPDLGGEDSAEALRNFLAGARAATGVQATEP